MPYSRGVSRGSAVVHWNLDLTNWRNLFVISRVRYISRFCSIHFTVTLAGLENNYRSLYRGLRYIEVRYISRFCSTHFTVTLAGLENNYRSLYRELRYIEGSLYIKVLFHTFYCNFGRAGE